MTDATRTPARELADDATAEAAQRARETLATQCGTQLPLLAGAALLLLEPASRTAAAWFGVAAVLLLVAGAAVWQFGTERGREDQAGVLLAEYAVLRSVDPGVGRREAADATAEGFVAGRYIAWSLALAAVGLLLAFGQWDQPAWAVPGAVLVVVGAVVHLYAAEREARAGRRWLAGPPGPPRD
ncbi:hypothetical protein SAMN05660662_3516 [Blastococcus aurantiacus]|uniref:Uncharacterized protein n=1 Tax=Blastococcus aurantiacus TaxID=1550231 RepID=A0A1G7P8J2_9ACTN|nr:hypothetical protein [Blastococcus aurantiacus]SDF82457.1 hypothetical protein SAMN05660662_3516 [Blastococcus aurantiacus]